MDNVHELSNVVVSYDKNIYVIEKNNFLNCLFPVVGISQSTLIPIDQYIVPLYTVKPLHEFTFKLN